MTVEIDFVLFLVFSLVMDYMEQILILLKIDFSIHGFIVAALKTGTLENKYIEPLCHKPETVNQVDLKKKDPENKKTKRTNRRRGNDGEICQTGKLPECGPYLRGNMELRRFFFLKLICTSIGNI